jgi:predicted acetyltransferase
VPEPNPAAPDANAAAPPELSVRPVEVAERPVLDRLWQLYMHDLSAFRGSLPDAEGRFSTRVPDYLDDPDALAALIRTGETPVGFVLVRGLAGEPHTLGEFFVIRSVRRAGVGAAAARQVMLGRPGRWQIAFQDENPRGARFWRRLATDLAGSTWTEERRPVPGKPHLPPDVWLTLEVPAADARSADR